jgi:hypothetical protein
MAVTTFKNKPFGAELQRRGKVLSGIVVHL